ncbi:MAG: DUF423 domain-containing protein [Sedimenticola sp.]|nr:MAG: DUF423 domain-containing protein [Sedimenticola sp.]
MRHPFLFIGALNGFLTVALGAFGAHALRDRLQGNYYEVFQTGIQYQGLHALALLILGLIALRATSNWLNRAGWLFLLGILLISGSLYLLAITGNRALGMITPLGGVCFLLGWLSLAIATLKLPAAVNSDE